MITILGTPLPAWPTLPIEGRVSLAVQAARMARDNARYYRSYGNEEGARAAFWRAYDYLDMARRWRME